MNKQKNGKALHLEHAAEEICFESLTVKDQEKLQEFGINPSSIPEEVYSIDCSSLNRVWHGIGMRNVHGGVEFISLTEMKRPTTIHRKGITLQPSKKGSVASCCLLVISWTIWPISLCRRTARLHSPRNAIASSSTTISTSLTFS